MDVKTLPSYGALLAVKYASRALYDIREEWVGDVPEEPWKNVRLIAVLHHTSLAEGIYTAVVPNPVLRQMARHAVLPVAQETMAKPIEGRIFRTLIPNAVSITRRRDESWTRVLEQADDPESMVALFPEGRMMRTDGMDKNGDPMTVKPGIAEVLQNIGPGRMVIGYSGGLHHVFKPGASLPRFLKSLRIRIESLDIDTYIAERRAEGPSFAEAVVRDLTRRRDLHTPIAPGTPAEVSAEVVGRRHRLLERRGERGSGRRGADGPDGAESSEETGRAARGDGAGTATPAAPAEAAPGPRGSD